MCEILRICRRHFPCGWAVFLLSVNAIYILYGITYRIADSFASPFIPNASYSLDSIIIWSAKNNDYFEIQYILYSHPFQPTNHFCAMYSTRIPFFWSSLINCCRFICWVDWLLFHAGEKEKPRQKFALLVIICNCACPFDMCAHCHFCAVKKAIIKAEPWNITCLTSTLYDSRCLFVSLCLSVLE